MISKAARVAVGMSGGVDSTVAALLLKRQGYGLIGVFMRNWDERDETGACSSDGDLREVERVCQHIGIPHVQVDFVKEYWTDVFSHFLWDYQNGRTPNPDILCNKHIKFNAFFQHAMESLKVDAIATGHYARIQQVNNSSSVRLLQAVDSVKDQTYFLCNVPQSVLQRTLFPVGHLMKAEVKKVAVEAGLERTAKRKESMGLCFIGKRKFPKFIHQYLEEREGDFITLDGRTVGQHRGHHYYTIGQRARLGGQARSMFVAGKDPEKNTVTVYRSYPVPVQMPGAIRAWDEVEGTHHPALFCHSFVASFPHWISGDTPDLLTRGRPLECLVRYRHQQALKRCVVEATDCSNHVNSCALLKVQSSEPLRAVTPGQFGVFYTSNGECLGGACVEWTGPSIWHLQHTGNSATSYLQHVLKSAPGVSALHV